MKDYLLDTNIIHHFARFKMGISTPQSEKIKSKLSQISDKSKILICAISIGEMEYGYNVADTKAKADVQQLCDHIKNYEILSIDQEIARDHYAEIRAILFENYAPRNEKKKRRLTEWADPISDKNIQVQENDIWICAVAKYYNLTLITDDKMEAIRKVTNLDIQNWI